MFEKFLDDADGRFGSAGCNDLELPNTPENRKMVENAIRSGMGDEEADAWIKSIKPNDKTIITYDFVVFGYLKDRVLEYIKNHSQPSETKC